MKRKIIAVCVFLVACLSIWLGAAVPQWIQFNERVVGENSPYYQDVVNRPMKTIWSNFTSQHDVNGGHKSTIFPTPLPTATPMLADVRDAERARVWSTLAANNGSFGGGMISPGKVFARPDSWSFFDTTTVNANSKGFYGGVFDGRYLYLIPNHNGSYFGQVTRYDTTGSFTDAASWSVFNTSTVNSASKGFIGGVFDGRYLYLIPNSNGSAFGQVTRYDTTGSFTDAASWSVFDTTTVNANSKGFFGGVFDGRYLYLIPNNNGSAFGQVTRYDTAGSFADAASWIVFDTTTVNANSKGFFGGVFDGRYLYLIPSYNGAFFGQVTRYDTTGSFTDAASWSVFDTTAVNSASKGFRGGAFDGRYLYLIPYNNGAFFGQVTRYDTTGSFTDAASWSVFNTTTVNSASKGFIGGAFDGRYLYLIPNNNGSFSGQVTRYDTTGSFTDAASWSVFNTTTVNSASKGFFGGAFDGRYLYLIPYNNGAFFGQVTRYDTGRNGDQPIQPVPTPAPTATPKPDATPQPTATPKPDATPQPTATPISTTVLNHAADMGVHLNFFSSKGLYPSEDISPTDGSCQGVLQRINSTGTFLFPSAAEIATNKCHTVRIVVLQNTGAITLSAGPNTTFVYDGNMAASSLTSSSTPGGYYIELIYATGVDKWIVTAVRGTWTAS